jgi:hypothetical protein
MFQGTSWFEINDILAAEVTWYIEFPRKKVVGRQKQRFVTTQIKKLLSCVEVPSGFKEEAFLERLTHFTAHVLLGNGSKAVVAPRSCTGSFYGICDFD